MGSTAENSPPAASVGAVKPTSVEVNTRRNKLWSCISVKVNSKAGGAKGTETVLDADEDHWRWMWESNVLGTVNDVPEIVRLARAAGAQVLVTGEARHHDAAQFEHAMRTHEREQGLTVARADRESGDDSAFAQHDIGDGADADDVIHRRSG